MNSRIRVNQAFEIICQQITAFSRIKMACEPVMGFGEKPPHIIQEPINFGARAKKDTTQNKPGDMFRIGNRISKRQGASP